MSEQLDEFSKLMSTLFRPHSWHGVSAGDEAPDVVNAYIEIVPTDPVKLELDKASSHLAVDRPQRFSSLCPTLYGFVPQTYCGKKVGDFCAERTGLKRIIGDGDPLDICVLTEKDFAHGDLLVRVRPIGGLRMIDKGEADDKIVAVLVDDIAYGGLNDISECPVGVIERLRHYFLSYKQLPGEEDRTVKIPDVYNKKEALSVIKASAQDYVDEFGTQSSRMQRLFSLLSNAASSNAKAGADTTSETSQDSRSELEKLGPERNGGIEDEERPHKKKGKKKKSRH